MEIECGGRVVGRVTSGTFAPSLEQPIGMGYVETGCEAPGTALEIRAGEARLPARVATRPFYTRATHR